MKKNKAITVKTAKIKSERDLLLRTLLDVLVWIKYAFPEEEHMPKELRASLEDARAVAIRLEPKCEEAITPGMESD